MDLESLRIKCRELDKLLLKVTDKTKGSGIMERDSTEAEEKLNIISDVLKSKEQELRQFVQSLKEKNFNRRMQIEEWEDRLAYLKNQIEDNEVYMQEFGYKPFKSEENVNVLSNITNTPENMQSWDSTPRSSRT